jgi:hypothetical protein
MQGGVRISLELEPGDPVSGSVRDAAGNAQRFSGWLEMHSLIERLRNATANTGEAPRAQHQEGTGR